MQFIFFVLGISNHIGSASEGPVVLRRKRVRDQSDECVSVGRVARRKHVSKKPSKLFTILFP